MKEVMAIIRSNMINQTKRALLLAGIDAITARPVMGRGKKGVNFELCASALNSENMTPEIAETLTESHKLIAKRLFTIIVSEEQLQTAIDTVISVNKTGNPGDGKIFVMPVEEAYRVRTGDSGDETL